MEYTVIWSTSKIVFEEVVNDAIRTGWTPQGGVSVAIQGDSDINGNYLFCQAMIRNNVEKSNEK